MGVYKRESAEREADEIGLKFAQSNDVIGDMSRVYHVDFSNIQIHTDASADRRVKNAGKDALAVGKDLFFGRGVFESQNPENKALVAHEFAHTMQQGVVGDSLVSESVPMGAEQGGRILDFFKRLFSSKKPEDNLMFAKDPSKAGGSETGKFWREGNTSESKMLHTHEKRKGLFEYLSDRYSGTEYDLIQNKMTIYADSKRIDKAKLLKGSARARAVHNDLIDAVNDLMKLADSKKASANNDNAKLTAQIRALINKWK